jgi:hypothetical protein
MTRQEAIQEQIDEIMDTFDFEDVHTWMEHSNWAWGGLDGDGESRVPSIYEIRTEARNRLKQAAKSGFSCSGGFTATRDEGEDENGPWVKLNLNFGLMTVNDGTSYTKSEQ